MQKFYSMTAYPRSAKLALVAAIIAAIVILMGGYTRITQAGLSCPDWPNCYGLIIAPHTPEQIANANLKFPATPVDSGKAWTEMRHRYLAGIEASLVIALSIILLWYGPRSASIRALCGALLLMIVMQVILGMLTVTALLKPTIVLSHLLIGISILMTLWSLYLLLTPDSCLRVQLPKAVKPWLALSILVVFVQIALGGWVTTHNAGLACAFPYCHGEFFPAIHWRDLNQDLISIQTLHRLGALITTIVLGFLSLLLFIYKRTLYALWIINLILLQLTLGIINVIARLPVGIALAHQAVAILIILTLVTGYVSTVPKVTRGPYA